MTRRALLTLWASRDRRYGLPRRYQLTDADVDSIRGYAGNYVRYRLDYMAEDPTGCVSEARRV